MAKTLTKIRNGNVETVDFSLLLLGLDKIKQEAKQNLGGNDDLKRELDSKIESIIKEKEIKTVGEKISDLAETIAKSPEIERGSEIGIMAKKIELAVEEIARQHPGEVEELKKEEFKKSFDEEAKKLNPKLNENQTKNLKEYRDLVAENYFGDNILEGQKNEALEANSRLISPGRLESSWTDLKGIVNFLQKSPEKLRGIKEKYNSLKESLSGVNLPNLKEGRSFEKIMAGFNDPNTDQLFARTKKYLGWADRVDKLTGGWLNKTVTDAGLKFASKIGNQAIQEFATNALGQIAQLGFKDGATAVLNGVLSGGVKVATTTAEGLATGAKVVATGAKVVATGAEVAATGAEVAAGTAGGAATGGIATIVVLALEAVKFIKKGLTKIAEKLGISTKKFFEENFGKVGGKILGGIASVAALPALLIGTVSAAAVGPILIIVFAGLFGYQILQGGLISSLVPPKGTSDYEEVIDSNSDINYENINYTGSAKTVGSYTWNGIIFYVFEGSAQGRTIKSADRYDLAYIENGIYLGSVGKYALGSNNKLDERVISVYTAMVDAGRASGQLSESGDLMLISGYRSKSEQVRLWNIALEKYGDPKIAGIWASNPASGLSSHATGRTVDIRVDGGCKGQNNYVCTARQKQSSTYKWLQQNASKYGFYNYIDKDGISVEPWHWEYNPLMPPSTNTL